MPEEGFCKRFTGIKIPPECLSLGNKDFKYASKTFPLVIGRRGSALYIVVVRIQQDGYP